MINYEFPKIDEDKKIHNSEGEQGKNSKKEKPKIHIKIEIEKEKNNKDMKKKIEKSSYNGEKNEQSNYALVSINSEKKENIKSVETASIKIDIKAKEKKFYNCIKEGKKREEKNIVNTPSEEYISQKNENNINYKRNINKFNKNEVYKNGSNKYSEDEIK